MVARVRELAVCHTEAGRAASTLQALIAPKAEAEAAADRLQAERNAECRHGAAAACNLPQSQECKTILQTSIAMTYGVQMEINHSDLYAL